MTNKSCEFHEFPDNGITRFHQEWQIVTKKKKNITKKSTWQCPFNIVSGQHSKILESTWMTVSAYATAQES